GLGHGRDPILEGGEFLDELLRDQVGPRGQDLAELGERWPELLHRGSKVLGLLPAGYGAPPILAAVEHCLDAVTGHDAGDLGPSLEQVWFDLRLHVAPM